MAETTLPTDSQERKNYALFRGCLRYFPAALAGVSKISKLGNDKHNPGQDLFHDREKSMDHGDCLFRHLMDVEDLLSAMNRGAKVSKEEILNEVSSVAWRALALSQELHEKFGAPLAPGARTTKKPNAVEEAKKLYDASHQAHLDAAAWLQKEKASFAKPAVKFTKGDVVQHINNDVEVIVEGTYFDENGKAVLFVKDADEKIFGVDPSFYKSIYKGT